MQEHGGNPRDLALYWQEDNGGVWSISKLNMILHGIPDARIENGDTLANPLHKESGELMRFHRVISKGAHRKLGRQPYSAVIPAGDSDVATAP